MNAESQRLQEARDGWTGVIARAMHLFATLTPEQVLKHGKGAAFVETDKPASSSNPASPAGRKRQGTV